MLRLLKHTCQRHKSPIPALAGSKTGR